MVGWLLKLWSAAAARLRLSGSKFFPAMSLLLATARWRAQAARKPCAKQGKAPSFPAFLLSKYRKSIWKAGKQEQTKRRAGEV
jgi:hypothetical protein